MENFFDECLIKKCNTDVQKCPKHEKMSIEKQRIEKERGFALEGVGKDGNED